MSTSQADNFRYDVCIVGLKCWDYFRGVPNPRYIGGIETDMVTLAKLLAESGLSVAFVVYDEGQNDVETIDGVDIYKTFAHDEGLPVLRLVHPRGTKLIQTLRAVNARSVLQMGAGVLTGWGVIACHGARPRQRFIFLAGSDSDCLTKLPFLSRVQERILYRFGLKRADIVVAQTTGQAQLLAQNFSISNAPVIRLPSRLNATPAAVESPIPIESARLQVLWVGRLVAIKRPEWLVDLAQSHGEVDFYLAGSANAESPFEKDIIERAQSVPNLSLLGRVAADQMQALYQRADLLLNTSELEGFPATILEALSVGTPIVTTFDPGGFIARYSAGATVTTQQELSAVLTDSDLRTKLDDWADQARELFAHEFSPEVGVRRVRAVLESA
ncbi:MAG: glycosyltransferase family 4 protein [Pseudomonadota bacterium]